NFAPDLFGKTDPASPHNPVRDVRVPSIVHPTYISSVFHLLRWDLPDSGCYKDLFADQLSGWMWPPDRRNLAPRNSSCVPPDGLSIPAKTIHPVSLRFHSTPHKN